MDAARGIQNAPTVTVRAGVRRAHQRLSPAPSHWGEISARQIWHRRADRHGGGARHFPGCRMGLSQGTGLARVRPSPAVSLSRDADRQFQPPLRRLSLARRRGGARALAARAHRLSRSSMPACASCGTPAGCTTACAWSSPRSWSSTCCSPGRQGARWFWDTLVDADLANNALGLAMGRRLRRRRRALFPHLQPGPQGERFDPEGDYVRRWVPELAALPDKWIHQPWNAPAEGVLTAAGVAPWHHLPRSRLSTTKRPAPARWPRSTRSKKRKRCERVLAVQNRHPGQAQCEPGYRHSA